MSDLLRIFLICVCMYLSFRLGVEVTVKRLMNKTMTELNKVMSEARKAIEEIVKKAEAEDFDAPVPLDLSDDGIADKAGPLME